jgi:hypothetical protein
MGSARFPGEIPGSPPHVDYGSGDCPLLTPSCGKEKACEQMEACGEVDCQGPMGLKIPEGILFFGGSYLARGSWYTSNIIHLSLVIVVR